MVVLSSGLLLGFSLLTTYTAAIVQQESLNERQSLVSKNAADTVNDYIQSKIDILEVAIKTGNILSPDMAVHKDALEKVLGYEQSFTQLLLYHHDTTLSTHVSRFSNGNYENFIGQITKNEFFADAIHKPHLSEVYIDERTSEPLMVMAVPVVDVFGESQSTLFAEVNLKFMWDFLSQVDVGKGGVAYVVDKTGRLIAFNDISRVLSGERLGYLDEVARYLGQLDSRHEHTSFTSTGIFNTRVVTAHEDLELTAWGVVVEQPVLEAYSDLIKQVRLQLTFLVLSLLLAAFTAILLARRISYPVIALRDATQAVGAGKWGAKIETSSRNEIGQLATAFNTMVLQLRGFYDDLEKRVEERSKQLSAKISELETLNRLMVDREIKMIELKKKLKQAEAEKCTDTPGSEKGTPSI